MKTPTKKQRHVIFKKVQAKLHSLEDVNMANYQYLCYEVAKTKKFVEDSEKQIAFAKAMTELMLFSPTPNYEESCPWFIRRELENELKLQLKRGSVTVGEVRLLALALMIEMTK